MPANALSQRRNVGTAAAPEAPGEQRAVRQREQQSQNQSRQPAAATDACERPRQKKYRSRKYIQNQQTGRLMV